MRPPVLKLQRIGRAGAVLLVAVAILALAIAIRLSDRTGRSNGRANIVGELRQTSGWSAVGALGTAAENDAECLATWAQLRRRFFDTKPPAGGCP